MRRLLFFATLVLFAVNCASPDSLLLNVDVKGLSSAVKSLSVTLRLDGKLASEGDVVVTDHLDHFVLRLPSTTTGGNLSMVIAGLDGNHQALVGDTVPVGLNIDTPSLDVQVTLKPQRICTTDNWCWTNPLPQGNTLHGVWGNDARDLFAIGDNGTILRWNGGYWSGSASGTKATLNGIWGSGPKDIWAVGSSGTIL